MSASNTPYISAIVIALEEGDYLRQTILQLEATLPEGSEIVVVDDGSTDGCSDFLETHAGPARLFRRQGLGVAGARNFGASKALGQLLFFIDAHMTLPEGWLAPLVGFLEANPRAAVAPCVTDTTQRQRKGYGLRHTAPEMASEWLGKPGDAPVAVPVLPGCTLGVHVKAFHEAGGFDGGMLRSQGVDNEFCLRWWLLGNECWVIPTVLVVHLFREQLPYKISWETVLHNRLRLGLVHLDQRRLTLQVNELRTREAFGGAMALVAESDALERRKKLAETRTHDVEWFFNRFGPEW